MIKVKHTEQHEDKIVCKGKLVLVKILHGNFPIPESSIYYCDFIEDYHNGKNHKKGHKLTIQQDCCYGIIPIIISESEEIEVGDSILNYLKNDIIHLKDLINIHPECTKILALPEHFSPEQLQMIVEGKLEDGDEVMVECEVITKQIEIDKHETYAWIKLNQQNHITLIDNEPIITKDLVDPSIIDAQEESWDDTWNKWCEVGHGNREQFLQNYIDWLKENYNPPKRK